MVTGSPYRLEMTRVLSVSRWDWSITGTGLHGSAFTVWGARRRARRAFRHWLAGNAELVAEAEVASW